MAKLKTKIKEYLGRDYNPFEEVIIQNDGDGNYIAMWNVDGVEKPTDAQLDALESDANDSEADFKLGLLRTERDIKLAETDWTQAADSPLSDSDKTAWATYRQSLRDITDTATSLEDVTWPTKP